MTDDGWLERVVEAVELVGCAVVEGVLDADTCARTKEAMYSVQEKIRSEIGGERLGRAGELGVLRLMLRYDDHFFRFLELPKVIAVVDAMIGETAILHLQNGLVLPPLAGETPETFQTSFHRDFPRYLNGYVASLNCFFAIDEFTAANGGTVVVPGSHQRFDKPSPLYLESQAVSVECAAGSMLVFDSTLWHAAGANGSQRDRLAINQQFTRSFFKQQIDYVRALGDDVIMRQAERTKQLVGWYTRVVTSLDEFYRPPEERLYRSGQG